jgi:hypothetical protein
MLAYQTRTDAGHNREFFVFEEAKEVPEIAKGLEELMVCDHLQTSCCVF